MRISGLARRSILAGGAAMAFVPTARAEDVEVLVVGAGAAGIGAARELARLGRKFVIVEARQRSGGRLHTSAALGQPFDGGAAYIHFAETNPWTRIAEEAGVDPRGGYRLWSGSRAFRDGVPLDMEAAARRASLMPRVNEAYEEVEERQDVSLAQALREEEQEVRDLGRIQSQMAAGEDPEWVSTSDWMRLEGGQNRLVPGGYGALAVRTAAPLGVRHGVRVAAIDWSGQLVVATTSEGTIRARKAIVTVPVGVLKAGDIRFTPALPLEHARALDGLRMGALSKVALRFEGERFGPEMVMRGSLERLTPVLMTALIAAFALTPLLLAADAPGKEILHPVAVVIFGGLISSTLLDTLLTPIMYLKFGRRATESALAEGFHPTATDRTGPAY